jgi:hypothetical protein
MLASTPAPTLLRRGKQKTVDRLTDIGYNSYIYQQNGERKMARKTAPEVREIPVSVIVAAAIVAYDRNGKNYYRESLNRYNEETEELELEATANKMIVRELVKNNYVPSAEQLPEAEELISFAQKSLMMSQLVASKAPSSFEQSMTAAVTATAIKSNDFLSIGILAFLPEYCARARHNEEISAKVAFSDKTPLGAAGGRVVFNGEVTKSVFSDKWGTFYITVLTEKNQLVWFAYKKGLALGTKVSGTGTIKRLTDDGGQLNRVKIF